MSRTRQWTHAKHVALMKSQTEPPLSSKPLPNYVPVTDRSPMGYARRDAEQVAVHLSGEIAELQRQAAALSHDADAERIADALHRIISTAANALALAGRVRGAREAIAMFEVTP